LKYSTEITVPQVGAKLKNGSAGCREMRSGGISPGTEKAQETIYAAKKRNCSNEEKQGTRYLEQDRGKPSRRIDPEKEGAQGAEQQPCNDSHDGSSSDDTSHNPLL
jgi:hypothetical protein